MPVIVVGADTVLGRAVVEGLMEPGREVRAFVTDIDAAAELKRAGVKVALGDVSDDSQIEGASLNCFTAVLIAEAARDGRERSFAATEDQVLRGWANATAASGVTRVIWVHDGETPPVEAREARTVSPSHPELVAEVVALDDAGALATDVGDVPGESGAPPGKDAGRRRTGPFVEDEDAASDVIWPS